MDIPNSCLCYRFIWGRVYYVLFFHHSHCIHRLPRLNYPYPYELGALSTAAYLPGFYPQSSDRGIGHKFRHCKGYKILHPHVGAPHFLPCTLRAYVAKNRRWISSLKLLSVVIFDFRWESLSPLFSVGQCYWIFLLSLFWSWWSPPSFVINFLQIQFFPPLQGSWIINILKIAL